MQETGGPGWPALDRLGVKWKHAGLNQSPVGYTRFGTLRIDGLGKTSVSFLGSRSEPRQVSLFLPGDKAVDKSEFGDLLKRLLPNPQAKQVRAGCKDEGSLGGSAVYQVVLPGHRPAYVLMSAGTSKMGLDTSMDIATQFSKDWKTVRRIDSRHRRRAHLSTGGAIGGSEPGRRGARVIPLNSSLRRLGKPRSNHRTRRPGLVRRQTQGPDRAETA